MVLGRADDDIEGHVPAALALAGILEEGAEFVLVLAGLPSFHDVDHGLGADPADFAQDLDLIWRFDPAQLTDDLRAVPDLDLRKTFPEEFYELVLVCQAAVPLVEG